MVRVSGCGAGNGMSRLLDCSGDVGGVCGPAARELRVVCFFCFPEAHAISACCRHANARFSGSGDALCLYSPHTTLWQPICAV